MADSSLYPDSGDETEGRGSTTGTPRWVKVFATIGLVLVVLVVILLLSGGGHGPGRHTGSGGAGGHMPASGVTESAGIDRHAASAGGHTA